MKIAIIYFPGINCELESKHACELVGMQADIIRWNENVDLSDYDGYVIPGGWSYEDRVRAGIISSKDPIVASIRREADKGKPVFGICNGAQVLVESGLVPDIKGGTEMSLAPNINPLVKGFYCVHTNCMLTCRPSRTAFTLHFDDAAVLDMPIAHGEGCFTSRNYEIVGALEHNDQIVFKYCDDMGKINRDFPVNPNGSLLNIAGICNTKGNVFALMPHPERVAHNYSLKDYRAKSFEDAVNCSKSILFFKSMRDYITDNKKVEVVDLIKEYEEDPEPVGQIGLGSSDKNILRLYVRLIIPDNMARTAQQTLKNMGFDQLVSLTREDYYEFTLKDCADNCAGEDQKISDFKKIADKLSKVDVISNYNKHRTRFDFGDVTIEKADDTKEVGVIVKHEDPEDNGLLQSLKNNFGFDNISHVEKGVFWKFSLKADTKDYLELVKKMTEELLASVHYQTYVVIE
ncbi:phosphoribosylformylglycinamidine synthase I [Candidatus Woesearchaeota archaeon]|nr:phosphoribosylformylglycinamidine synthase I [Candidatus Woesearchaeota archaeon]